MSPRVGKRQDSGGITLGIMTVAKDLIIIKNGNEVVRIHNASESAGSLESKLIDQCVHDEL